MEGAKEWMQELELPVFKQLRGKRRILLAGCGGGFDIYSGMPLYFALKNAGMNVALANLTFVHLPYIETKLEAKGACAVVTADTKLRGIGNDYFPERALLRYLKAKKGIDEQIYTIAREGPVIVSRAYEYICEDFCPDAVILVDGGTDSLMRGDEYSVGSPEEDCTSIVSVAGLALETKIMACIGFGVDFFHGVHHVDFLESVAALEKAGGYLGCQSLQPGMSCAQEFIELYLGVESEGHRTSIVQSSVISAMEGQFGDYHHTQRTRGSELFINPLMSLMWFFDVEKVAKRMLYADALKSLETRKEVAIAIHEWRRKHREELGKARKLPM